MLRLSRCFGFVCITDRPSERLRVGGACRICTAAVRREGLEGRRAPWHVPGGKTVVVTVIRVGKRIKITNRKREGCSPGLKIDRDRAAALSFDDGRVRRGEDIQVDPSGGLFMRATSIAWGSSIDGLLGCLLY
ncbi:hypothetical protein MTP99_016096 [Tenebrio molitor]|jgi:hypothetical protein|nr:hypothetical protein MTP99_016096 [Tenebrio molitor]